eukprot:scaffold277055_cov27-Tisochrysis_lutea.AAC.2
MTPEEKHHLADGLRRAYDDAQETQARDIIALGLKKLNKGSSMRRGSAKSLGRGAAAAAGALGRLSRNSSKMRIPGLKR